MTASWPAWDRRHFDGLTNYVLKDEVGRLGAFPAKSDREPLTRLREIYDELCRFGIRYEEEPVGAGDGLQKIRPPSEVLDERNPSGTCLDVALVAAGLCLRAGLHAYLVECDGHIVLAVWVGDAVPARHVNWDLQPNPAYPLTDAADLAALKGLGIRKSLRGDGGVVAVDVTRAAVGYLGADTHADFEAALAAGADLVLAPSGEWRVCDVGWRWRPSDQLNPGVDWDLQSDVFPAPIFDTPDTADLSPARLTRAQYAVVPFQRSATFDVVLDRTLTATTDNGPVVLVVHGGGGTGKTRLAGEVASRLLGLGWTAGVIRRGALDQVDLRRLRAVTGPLFLAIDYAEAALPGELLNVVRHLQRPRRHPAVVVLLARTAGHWWEQLDNNRRDAGMNASPHVLDPMPPVATTPRQMWRASIRAFERLDESRFLDGGAQRADAARGSADPPPVPPQPALQRWTSLDYVLLAWFKVREPSVDPTSRAELYDEVIRHEYGYWSTSNPGTRPDEARFNRWAAHLTAASPSSQVEAEQLVPDIDADSLDAFATIWSGGWRRDGRTEPLALRPDAVGDHLLRRHFGSEPFEFGELAGRTLQLAARQYAEPGDGVASESTMDRLVANLTRAETDNSDAATITAAMWTAAISEHPDLWTVLLAAAARGSASAARALECAVEDIDESTATGEAMLSGLAHMAPLGHSILRRASVIAAERHASLPKGGSDAERAAALGTLGIRLSEAGRREEALTAAEQATTMYRELAAANPAAFNADLAASLSNLGIRYSEVGRREEALTAAEQATTIRRELAAANPAAFNADLAASLSNLGNHYSEVGRREEALTAAEQATTMYRELAAANPAAFNADLARSLSNLGIRYSEVGRREEALTAAEQATTMYRELAAANPAAFNADLAASLSNLGIRYSEVGRREEALTAEEQATTMYRELAAANPAAFNADLAASLSNLGAFYSEVGRREEALTAEEQATTMYRELAAANPAAFNADLARSLSNLGIRYSEVGRREEALTAAEQATTIRRELAAANPAAFNADLAASLSNLGIRYSEVGRREEALTAAEQATTMYRELAAANPAAFNADLAASLSNLGAFYSEVGRREEALTAEEQATTIRRELAAANPAAFNADLARSLSNLGNHYSEVGRREEALTAAEQATTIRRELAAANPAAFNADLARSLSNLGIRYSEVGRREEALTAAEQATTIRRELAAANPAAFNADLAASLSNLGNHYSEVGRREEALTAAEQATTMYRELAAANPAAFNADLAASLSNLGAFYSEVGRREEALTAEEQATTIRRELAAANPAAFNADLAASLSNLGAFYSEVGRREEALTAAEQATTIRRELAAANPAAFNADLAASLSNLGIHYSEVGRREEALTAAEQATTIRRELAAANPAAFNADLAASLSNLGIHYSEVGRREEALTAAEQATTIRRELAAANPAAFNADLARSLSNLRAFYSEAGRDEDAEGVWIAEARKVERLTSRAWLLALAPVNAIDAGTLADATHQLDRAEDDGFLGGARRAVRSSWTQRDDQPLGLPRWVTVQVDDAVVAAVNSWLAARTWPDQSAWLETHTADQGLGQFAASVTTVADLFPEQVRIRDLAATLQQLAAGKLDLATMRDERDRAWEAQVAVTDWISTPTWPQSRAMLTERATALTSPAARAFLSSLTDDPNLSLVASQHLAILELIDRDGGLAEDVFDWAADSASAQLRAIEAMESGDTDTIRRLLALNPQTLTAGPHRWLMSWLAQVLDQGLRSRIEASASSPGALISPLVEALRPDERHAARLHLERYRAHVAAQTSSTTSSLVSDLDELIELLR